MLIEYWVKWVSTNIELVLVGILGILFTSIYLWKRKKVQDNGKSVFRVIVTGLKGSGKTTLIGELIHDFSDLNIDIEEKQVSQGIDVSLLKIKSGLLQGKKIELIELDIDLIKEIDNGGQVGIKDLLLNANHLIFLVRFDDDLKRQKRFYMDLRKKFDFKPENIQIIITHTDKCGKTRKPAQYLKRRWSVYASDSNIYHTNPRILSKLRKTPPENNLINQEIKWGLSEIKKDMISSIISTVTDSENGGDKNE